MNPVMAWLGGEEAIARWLAVGVLVAIRLAPLTVFAPWLAMRAMPAVVRTGLLLALTAALTPVAVSGATSLPTNLVALLALSAREVLIGTMFAVATALPLHALDWMGRLIDTWRGAALAEVIAPPTGERTSPMGDVYLLMGVAFFLAIGGHRLAIGALADTFITLPVGQTLTASGIPALALSFARLVGSALAFAAMLAAPAAVAIVLVELSLGLVARTTPQIPVFFAGMPLRAGIGLAAALLSLSFVADQLPRAFRYAIDSASGIVHLLR